MKYRKLPVEIEAFQWDGDMINKDGWYVPDWAKEASENEILYYDEFEGSPPCELFVKTLEGNHHASVGDYIIRGINGELYPCKPDIFEKTYEKVGDEKNIETRYCVVHDNDSDEIESEFVEDIFDTFEEANENYNEFIKTDSFVQLTQINEITLKEFEREGE